MFTWSTIHSSLKNPFLLPGLQPHSVLQWYEAVCSCPFLSRFLSHLTQISGGLMSPQCEPRVKVLLGGLTLHCCCGSFGLNAAESESFLSPRTGGSVGGKRRSCLAASLSVAYETHWIELRDCVSVINCSLQDEAVEERAGWSAWGGGFWQWPCWRSGVSTQISWIWSPHMNITQCWTVEWKVFFSALAFSVWLLRFSASLCDFISSCRRKEINPPWRMIVFQKWIIFISDHQILLWMWVKTQAE